MRRQALTHAPARGRSIGNSNLVSARFSQADIRWLKLIAAADDVSPGKLMQRELRRVVRERARNLIEIESQALASEEPEGMLGVDAAPTPGVVSSVKE